jgi:hypothetical protein
MTTRFKGTDNFDMATDDGYGKDKTITLPSGVKICSDACRKTFDP